MRKISKTEKILFVFALLAALGYFFSKLGDVGTILSSRNLNREIKIKKKLIAGAISLFEQKDKILADSGRYAQYSISVASEDYSQKLLKELQDIGSAAQVQGFDPKTVAPFKSDYILEYRAELEVQATLPQLMILLHGIQDSKSLLKVVRMRINPNIDKPDQLKVYLLIAKPTVF